MFVGWVKARILRAATHQSSRRNEVSYVLFPLLGVRGGGARPLRHIFGNDARIETRDCAVGQPIPDLVHAEQWNAEIAAERESLPVRAERHHRAVDFTIARIDDV